jgi:hypothetical protein
MKQKISSEEIRRQWLLKAEMGSRWTSGTELEIK